MSQRDLSWEMDVRYNRMIHVMRETDDVKELTVRVAHEGTQCLKGWRTRDTRDAPVSESLNLPPKQNK